MAEDMSGDPGADGRFVRLVDGSMHLVEDGRPGAPALLLIHGSAGSTAWWDPVVPALAGACRVIRVDLLGHGRSSSPARGYDIPAHAGRVGAALDRLGAGRVTVIGHSMGCMVATALAEQRPDKVAGLTLIDMGPSLDAASPDGLLVRLLLAQFPGRLLWRLRSEATIRKAMRSAFTRPVRHPRHHHRGRAGNDPPRPRGHSPRIQRLHEAAKPPRPARRARGPGSGDLRHRGRAVSLLVGCRLPSRSRRPRRVAARRGTHPDDGRPASHGHIVAGIRRSRRVPPLTAPSATAGTSRTRSLSTGSTGLARVHDRPSTAKTPASTHWDLGAVAPRTHWGSSPRDTGPGFDGRRSGAGPPGQLSQLAVDTLGLLQVRHVTGASYQEASEVGQVASTCSAMAGSSPTLPQPAVTAPSGRRGLGFRTPRGLCGSPRPRRW